MTDSSRAASFVTVKPGDQTAPRTVLGVLPLDAYLVQYRDQDNKEQVRVVFNVKGTADVLITAERIGGDAVTVHARSWFSNALKEKIGETGKKEEGPVSV